MLRHKVLALVVAFSLLLVLFVNLYSNNWINSRLQWNTRRISFKGKLREVDDRAQESITELIELDFVTFLPCNKKKRTCVKMDEGGNDISMKALSIKWKQQLKLLLDFASLANKGRILNVNRISIMVSVDCMDDSLLFLTKVSTSIQLNLYVVQNGDEMMAIHLLRNSEEFFSAERNGNINLFVRRGMESQLYSWFNFSQPYGEKKQDYKLLFVRPGYFLPQSTETIKKLKSIIESSDFAIQEDEALFPDLSGLYNYIKESNSRLQIWDYAAQANLQGKLVKGKMSFVSPFSTHDKYYRTWYKEYGRSIQHLTEYRSLTSPSKTFLQSLKPISFFYLNYGILNATTDEINLDDGLNDEFSGNKCVAGVYRGFIDSFLQHFGEDTLMVQEIVRADVQENMYSPFYRLRKIDHCINLRQLTYSLHKSKQSLYSDKGSSSKKLGSQVFSKQYGLYYKSHVFTDRVVATVKAWSRQLNSVGTSFNLIVPTTDEATIQNFSNLASSESVSNLDLMALNQTDIALRIPMEALNLYQMVAEDDDGIMLTEKMGDVWYSSINIFDRRAIWLFTQLTWSPAFADILLNYNDEPDEEQNQYFWFIDYDAVFSGKISDLLNLTDDIPADLMAGSQVLSYVHDLPRIYGREGLETGLKWMWWPWGRLSIQEYIRNSDEICFEGDEEVGIEKQSSKEQRHFMKKYSRRTFANSFRLSKRMVRWIAEATFVPDKFFWTLDEILYPTICKLHEAEGCSYYPFNAVNVNKMFPHDKNEPLPVKTIHHDKVFGFLNINYMCDRKIHLAKDRSDMYEHYVGINRTRYQMWHAVKSKEVFSGEWWLN